MIDLVIRDGQVVTPEGVGAWDVAVEGERIVAVAIADTVREGSTSRRDRPADSLGSGSTISEIATRPHEDWSKHGQVRSRKPGNR